LSQINLIFPTDTKKINMNKFPTGIRVAQAVGLTGAGWLAGTLHCWDA
jgi:hypothetical protein